MKAVMRLIGTKKFLSNMKRLEKKVPDAAKMSMYLATELLRGYIAKNKLSGQKLKVRTGHLRSSIKKEVRGSRDEVVGRVGSNLKYAPIQERGGPLKAITIVPVKAKALRFYIGGKLIIVKAVHMPAFAIKPKYYIKSSMREMSGRLRRVLGQKFFMELKSGIR